MPSEIGKLRRDAISLLGGTLNQKKPPYKISWVLYRLISYEFLLILFHRINSELYRFRLLRPLSLLFFFFHKLFFKVDIHPAARIGAGFQLVHGFSVVIGAQCQLGENVAIFDGVSLGKKEVGHKGEMPVIGSNVILGSGAKILGDVFIADNSIVGANAVVLESFREEGSRIAGVPAKIISAR